MDESTRKELEGLTAAAPKVREDLDSAAGEVASWEEIESAKETARDFFKRYDLLIKRLGRDATPPLMARLGLEIESVREKLSRLQEAPE